MVKIAGLSDQNRRPETPRKPNEDAWASWTDGNLFAAAVMDGIPVLRGEGGIYPEANGAIASASAVRTICETLRGASLGAGADDMKWAFAAASNAIQVENQRRNLYAAPHPMWIATVGCAVWGNLEQRKAIFGWIGDPIGFFGSSEMYFNIPADDPGDSGFRLLAGDQLHPWIKHFTEEHKVADDGRIHDLRLHQDRYVRNKRDAQCWCGEKVSGWGALTGEPEAMDFFRTEQLAIVPGHRIILASDGICALAGERKRLRIMEDYDEALRAIANIDTDSAANELLRRVREYEVEHGETSDDVTIVIVDC